MYEIISNGIIGIEFLPYYQAIGSVKLFKALLSRVIFYATYLEVPLRNELKRIFDILFLCKF